MLRSLYSSISGMQNHQVRMDLIGNNIANVNTIGYKSSRVTFEESFSQMLSGATRPPGDGGGTNPIQVGLGMSVGSVDSLLTQGSLQSTGQITDLAIEGDSYFAVKSGDGGEYYTRNGAFQIDSSGNLVLPTNGFKLQGYMADEKGNFPPGTTVSDITIPFDEQAAAQETTEVNFARNLNADSEPQGTVVHTQSYIRNTGATDSLEALLDTQGQPLNIREGDTLTFSTSVVNTGAGTSTDLEGSWTVEDTDGSGVIEVSEFVNAFNAWATTNAAPATMSLNAQGEIELQNTAGAGIVLRNMQITTDNQDSKANLVNALNFPSNIAGGATETSAALRSPAEATDLLFDLYDRNGQALGLEAGDVISVNGTVGGESLASSSTVTYAPATTTMQDILDMIKDELRLPTYDGTPKNNLTVSMGGAYNLTDGEDNMPDGSIVVRGNSGEAFAIDGFALVATNSNNSSPAPTLFNSNSTSTQVQEARDHGKYDTSITVYDDSGATHDITMTFTHTGVPGEWRWDVTTAGDESIISGNTGRLSFGLDGSVSSFTFDDGTSQFVMNPNNGANQLEMNLNVGGPGNFQGLTQFEGPTTASAIGQDGYGTGALQDVSVDEFGFISGVFSNGTNKSLGRILVVDFTNPAGLQKMSDSVYTVSANSGDPIKGTPGEQSSSTLRPGALELSNVDLSREFTDMITTQRGFQANSRVITVSDSMLEELVNLKR